MNAVRRQLQRTGTGTAADSVKIRLIDPPRLAIGPIGDDHLVLRASGDLTTTSLDMVTNRLGRIIDGGVDSVVIDMGGVRSIASEVVDALLQSRRTLRARGGSLDVRSAEPGILRCLINEAPVTAVRST